MSHFVVCVKPVDRQAAESTADKGDRVALEVALRLRERAAAGPGPGPATSLPVVSVLVMGPPAAEGVARQTLAAGADRAWLLSDRALAGSDAQATARALAAATRYLERTAGPVDLVLTGLASSDGGTGQVGPALATLLDLPLVHGATGLDLVDLPALVTVARTAFAPRAVTMIGIVQARTRPLVLLDCATIGLDARTVGEEGSATRAGRILPSPAGRRAEFLAGNQAEQARAIVELIRGRGLLPSGRQGGASGG